jgi:hypothetical protein
MTTKPPSPVKKASETSLEKAAYASVDGIPAVDDHDLDRLAYNVWLWLTTKRDSLEHAVRSAGVRLKITEEEAVKKIRENLQQRGIIPSA